MLIFVVPSLAASPSSYVVPLPSKRKSENMDLRVRTVFVVLASLFSLSSKLFKLVIMIVHWRIYIGHDHWWSRDCTGIRSIYVYTVHQQLRLEW